MRLTTFSRAFALFALLALSAGVAIAEPAPDPADSRYDSAIKALREGREEDALILLNEVLSHQPKHAGAWLDLAIAYCDLGHLDRAESLFAYVETAFDPAPALRQVIAHYRAGGCRRTLAPTRLTLRLYAGHVGNANQGTDSPFVRFGLPGQTIDLQLTDRYLPRADRALGSELTFEHPLFGRSSGNSHWQVFGGANLRRYSTEHDFDIGLLTGGIARRAEFDGWRLDAQLQASRLWLGSTAYQSGFGLWTSLWAPVRSPSGELLPGGLRPGADLTLVRYRYAQNPAYDSIILDGRFKFLAQLSEALTLQAGAGAQLDRASNERPGGDRMGPVAQLLVGYALAPRHRLEAAGEWRRLRDAEGYSPLLFEGAVRLQKQQYLMLAWQWSYRDTESVRLEWRRQSNADSLPPFSYTGASLIAYWQKNWELK